MPCLVIVALASFIISLGSSFATQLWLHQRIAIVGDFIGLFPSHNSGIAFGISLGSFQTFWILVALAIVAYSAIRMAKTCREHIGFGLIIGGGLSNVIDRALDGYVNDMIQIGAFPIFNIADMCINIGIALLFLDGLHQWMRTKQKR